MLTKTLERLSVHGMFYIEDLGVVRWIAHQITAPTAGRWLSAMEPNRNLFAAVLAYAPAALELTT